MRSQADGVIGARAFIRCRPFSLSVPGERDSGYVDGNQQRFVDLLAIGIVRVRDGLPLAAY